MGIFKFRLESLMKIQIDKEDKAKRELKIYTEKLQLTREELLNLSDSHIKALRTLVESQKGRISVHHLINNHQFCQFLKEEVERKQREVINLELVVEEKKEELFEVIKQRKMLEKLKEKQWTSFVTEEEKGIQNELDQIASTLSIS